MWTTYDVQPTDARPSTSYSKSANDLWASELKTSGSILQLLHRNHNIRNLWRTTLSNFQKSYTEHLSYFDI
jgi:hypothetical protein